MANINLLPWREDLRNQRNKEFGIVAGISAGLGALVILVIVLFYNSLIDNQNGRNKFIEGEIAKLEEQIKEIEALKATKERLLQRITAIQKLESNRTEIVHLFDETVKNVPDGVYLKTLAQNGDKLTMRGIAKSNAQVSEFVGNIEKSVWMTAPRIDVITRNKGTALQTNNFTLQLKQANPNRKKNEDEG